MPTYLIHGFRWSRKAIRIFATLQDIDDDAPEWIIGTPTAFLNAFYTAFDFLPAAETSSPSLALAPYLKASTVQSISRNTHAETEERPLEFNDWSLVKLLEQYQLNDLHCNDLHCTDQPYAYVGDHVIPISLSCDVTRAIETYEQRKTEELLYLSIAASSINTPISPAFAPCTQTLYEEKINRKGREKGKETATEMKDGITNLEDTNRGIRKMSSRDFRRRKKRIGWLEKLRDELEQEAEIGWYVVVCNDEKRSIDDVSLENWGMNKGDRRGERESGSKMEGETASTGELISTSTLGLKTFLKRRSESNLKVRWSGSGSGSGSGSWGRSKSK